MWLSTTNDNMARRVIFANAPFSRCDVVDTRCTASFKFVNGIQVRAQSEARYVRGAEPLQSIKYLLSSPEDGLRPSYDSHEVTSTNCDSDHEPFVVRSLPYQAPMQAFCLLFVCSV